MTFTPEHPARWSSRRKSPECLSDLRLDQLRLGELTADEAVTARAHLAGCPACAQADGGLADDARRFAAEVDVATWAARAGMPATPVWRRWLKPVLVPLGLTAGLVTGLAVVVRPGADTAAFRSKGGGDLRVATYVKLRDHDGPGTLYLGEPLRAGDRVAFRVTSSRGGYLAIASIDGRGKVSRFFPASDRPAWVDAGADVELGSAIELDDAPGRERVVAVSCREALPPATVVAAVERAARQNGEELGALDLPCDVARTGWTKAP